MLPELFRIGPLALPTYGALLAFGFFAALWLLRRRAPRFGLAPEAATDLGIAMLLAGLVGSKLLLVIVEWPRYVTSLAGLWELVRSAGVFYGGLIGAVLVAVFILRRRHISFWAFADAASPAVALGQAFGRLGCLAAGCCWGRECHLPWAITFTNPLAAEKVGTPLGVPLHPTQLYEALGTALLCLLLVTLERRPARGPSSAAPAPSPAFPGETFARYLIGYGALRFAIEMFRGDPRGALLHGALSTSQAIALAAVAAGLALWALRRRVSPAPAVA